MKAFGLILLVSIGVMISSNSFASCGTGTSNRCTQPQPYCDELMGPCQCTDPGYNKYHTCMTESEYCRVFGNVGAH